jgi:hypothetical protein
MQSHCVGGPVSLLGTAVDHDGVATAISALCAANAWPYSGPMNYSGYVRCDPLQIDAAAGRE